MAAFLTMAAYLGGILLVLTRVPVSWRLPAVGTLPIVWISLCSLAGALETFSGIHPAWSLGPMIALLWLAVLVTVIRRRSGKLRPVTVESDSSARWITLPSASGLLISLIISAFVMAEAVRLEPWGSWDSIFTWVIRARFFVFGGDEWSNTFSHDLALLHPDYPPLLGWALAALWQLDGVASPGAVSWLMLPVWPGFVCIVLSWGLMTDHQRPVRLSIALAALLVTPLIWKLAASRLADFLLADAILISAFWWERGTRSRLLSLLVIAGFVCGFAGLIKNEGLLWIAGFTVSVTASAVLDLLSRKPQAGNIPVRRLICFLAGLALPLLAIAVFKMTVAPPSDLVEAKRNFEISEIVQPGVMIDSSTLLYRLSQSFEVFWHQQIWEHLKKLVLNFQDWGITLWLLPVLLVTRQWKAVIGSPVFFAICIQLLGYYFVYLITPYHPYWHLSTSMSRIAAHIVPVLVCFLVALPIRERPRFLKSFDCRPALARGREIIAICLLIGLSVGNVIALQRGAWRLGDLPELRTDGRDRIGFPQVPVASYVSDELGIRDLYATQFDFVPTVLVVDRREEVLLARFRDEQSLKAYCDRYGWRLQNHDGGLGWARNQAGKELVQPVSVAPLR